MDKVKPINYFAAIPGRANRDERLTGLHFRVLGTVAGHDRMGRNGQCCWAGRDTLAGLVGCHPSRLSSAVSDLIELGYLEEQRHEEDARRKGYRVIYLAEQDAAGIGSKVKDDRLPTSNLNRSANRLPSGNLNNDGIRLQTRNVSQSNRLPKSNVNQADRLRKSNLKSTQDRVKDVVNQSVKVFSGKRNILSRNLNISSEATQRGFEKRNQREQERAQNALAKAIGNDGWEVLAAMVETERDSLIERVLDGEDEREIARTLTAEARLSANAQTVSAARGGA